MKCRDPIICPHYLFGQKSRFWPTFLKSFFEIFSLIPACQKLSPHLYAWKRRFEGVFLRKIHIIFTKSAPLEKHPLPISIKMAFWQPCWEQYLPFVYKKSSRNNPFHLIATEKWKPHPLWKLSSPICKKSGFLHPILKVSDAIFTIYLQKSTLWAKIQCGSLSKPQNEVLPLAPKNHPSPNRTKNGQNVPLTPHCLLFIYKNRSYK